MRVPSTRGRQLAIGAILAAAGSTLSCSSASDADDEPRPSAMQLRIAGQQVTVTGTGAVVGETVVLRVGVAASISAVFTDVYAVPITAVVPGEFRLDVAPLDSGLVTYTPSATNTLAGTLAATRASTGTSVRFALYHVTKQHIDWGPFTVTAVTVN